MFVTADPRPEPKKVIVVGDQNPYKAGLQGWERQILWEYMFGAESKRAENLVRLFNSTMEFGFPPAGMLSDACCRRLKILLHCQSMDRDN